jgi:hypothetical protein
MNRVLVKFRTPVSVVVALAVAAVAGGAIRLRPLSAQTAPSSTASSPVVPSGPPAPTGFADTVKRIYTNASSYAGIPGKGLDGRTLTAAAPMSAGAFNALVDSLTPDQLNELYDFKPDAWPRVDGILQADVQKAPPATVLTKIGNATAAAAAVPAPPAPQPTLAPGGGDYTPPEPEKFDAPPCPELDLGPDDGYDFLFAFDEAHDIASIPAQPFFAAFHIGAVVTISVLLTVESALELPGMTLEMLIETSTFCSTGQSEDEKDVINKNLVSLDNTSTALLALDNQIQTLEGQINQLADNRTQSVVTKLTTAQASLDRAQQQAIEESLQGGGATAVASYELPASLGGYLDSTPIGVKAIVSDAMAKLQQAGQPINPTATSSLTSANNALTAGQFKQAFVYYQAAYQALTK